MASTQEKILEALSSTLAGTDYVFRPPNYRKGNAVRELADLVWVCNGCVVLMYMQEKEVNERTPVQQARARRNAIAHNLKQAKGGIRAWTKLGEPLTGTNARQSFNIPYSNDLDVIAISVIECNDEEATFHAQETTKFGVAACVTLPHKALIEIGKVGGGVLEIIALVTEIVAASKRGEENINALHILNAIHLEAIQAADPEAKWLRPTEIEGLAMHIIQKLMRMRAPDPRFLDQPYTAFQITNASGAISGDALKAWGLGAILNDMPLSDFYSIACMIRAGIDKIVPTYDKWLLLELTTLSSYRICVVLSPTAELAKNDASCVRDFFSSVKQDADCRGALLITWIIDPEPDDTYSTYALETKVAPNQHGKKIPYTEEVIEQLRSIVEAS